MKKVIVAGLSMLAFAGCSIVPGSHTVELSAGPETFSVMYRPDPADDSKATVERVNGQAWSHSFNVSGPYKVAMGAIQGSCQIKVDGQVVASNSGMAAVCEYQIEG